MAQLLTFYLGKTMQVLGIATACGSLIYFFNQEHAMGPMLKWAMAGVAEFYVGYGITAMTGRK